MGTKLDQIVNRTRQGVAQRSKLADTRLLEQRAAAHTPRGFAAGLRRIAAHGPAVIAELKKASPSKGLIRADFRPVELALGLERAGAAALSVLTDEEFFQGSLHNLEVASSAVRIPCLRKDFIVDPFQILEARASGADAILLIVASHTDQDLLLLRNSARDHGLDVLCEVHDREEAVRAVGIGCEAIGVNSRDLRDFTVRSETLHELIELLPSAIVRVAESGIESGEDMLALRDAGYDAFLVGEALMRQADPGAGLSAMLRQATPPGSRTTWVKICGNTNLDDALLAAELGADAVGFVFAPSVRQVTPAQVAKITPHLPASVERVGVFPAWSSQEILAAVREAGLTTVQLHGGVDRELARTLHDKFAGNLRIIQATHWTTNFSFTTGGNEIAVASRGDRLLIDSKVGTVLGGTGVPFDWQAARSAFASKPVGLNLILAGGLNCENISEAIEDLQPWEVDVSSGVEAIAGRKTHRR